MTTDVTLANSLFTVANYPFTLRRGRCKRVFHDFLIAYGIDWYRGVVYVVDLSFRIGQEADWYSRAAYDPCASYLTEAPTPESRGA